MPTRSEYLDRIRLAEKTETLPYWGEVHQREIDAETRIEALKRYEEARGDGVYNVLVNTTLWAYVVRWGLLDEPGGRPIFTDEDLPVLMRQRPEAIQLLGESIWKLSEASPDATKSGDPPSDTGQLDTPSGAPTD